MSSSKPTLKRHIVAMGGGGFSMDPKRNTLLDDFCLGLTGKRRPKVCFVGTASGDAVGYVKKFDAAFPSSRAIASHLGLFERKYTDLAAFLLAGETRPICWRCGACMG